MKHDRFFLSAVLAMASSIALSAPPSVSNVTISQDSRRIVTVSYTLANGPAIVTCDFFTNGIPISTMVKSVSGDGNCLVSGDAAHSFRWYASRDWPDSSTRLANAMTAEVRAYHPQNPPDFIAMDLSGSASPAVRYYNSTNSLPGGIGSDEYRISKLLLKKCHVKYRTFQVGVPYSTKDRNAGEDTDPYLVTFTNDFYMGVFEVTHGQWEKVMGYNHNDGRFYSSTNDLWKVRPVNFVSMWEIRESHDTCSDYATTYTDDYRYPHSPNPDSFVGRIYSRTGLRCDLPSRSQWSVMSDAGQLYGFFGKPVTNTTDCAIVKEYGRYRENGGCYLINGNYVLPGDNGTAGAGCSLDYGTTSPGRYKPNAWGFYDTFGNVTEMTLDEFQGQKADNVHDPYGEAYVTKKDRRVQGNVAYISMGISWGGACGYGTSSCGRGGLVSNNQYSGFRVFYRVNQAGFYSDL